MTESDFDDDDDTPWASPEIQLGYEAALGRFIVAFNRIDNLLSQIIESVLQRLGREDLSRACTGAFWLKILALDLLKSSAEGKGIARIPIELLKRLANERNVLAHGHFDQNPFDGSYVIVGKSERDDYSVEKLMQLTQMANEAWDSLRYSEAYFEFSDVAVDKPK